MPSPRPVLPATPPRRLHFASLEALRFFAFLKVFFLHLPGFEHFPVLDYLRRGGGIGVQFFFVLSGFLITYLLVTDKLATGRVRVGRFLLRRSLRIWPLFYLGVAVAFGLLHWGKATGPGYVPDWRFSLTFLENYKMLLADNFPRAAPLPVFWSLCIEEHFYLVWMLAVYWLPVRRVPWFLLACLPLACAFRVLEPAVFANQVIETNDLLTHLDVFAVSGLLGYWVATDYEGFAARLGGGGRWARYGVLGVVAVVLVFQPHVLPYAAGSWFNVVRPLLVAALFTALLAFFLLPTGGLRLRSRWLAYLGSISYGLYVLHVLVIGMARRYCLVHHLPLDTPGQLAALVAVTLGGTIVLSSLSFRYFERPFLRLRERWFPA